jgi:hypothetical protein
MYVMELLVLPDQQVRKVLQEQLEQRDRKDLLGLQDHKVQQAQMELTAQMDRTHWLKPLQNLLEQIVQQEE